jgi:hypothetical protein
MTVTCPRRLDALVDHSRVTAARSLVTSAGGGPERSARVKIARAAEVSRPIETGASITWPCWSTARYT